MKILTHIKNAFKKKTDVAHFVIGFVAGIVNVFGFLGSILSAFITATFIIYQTGEKEPRIESYINMLEFVLGFIFAIPFLISIAWAGTDKPFYYIKEFNCGFRVADS